MKTKEAIFVCSSLLALSAWSPLIAGTEVPAATDATLQQGTSFRVRLVETLDTKRNRAGDRFTASLDEPLVSGDRVVVPKGTIFHGRIVESKPSGRFKGRAVLALRLDSFSLNGETHQIHSNSSARASAGHKKHHLAWIGGGSILIGSYRVISEGVDFLDQLADRLYWDKRKSS